MTTTRINGGDPAMTPKEKELRRRNVSLVQEMKRKLPLDTLLNAIPSITEPSELDEIVDLVVHRIATSGATLTQLQEFNSAVLKNPATPFQVLTNLEQTMKANLDTKGYARFRSLWEERWNTGVVAPVLSRDEWPFEPDQAAPIALILTTQLRSFPLETFAESAWEFTKEFLIEPNPSNLPELLEAFENNPASSANVVADAMAQALLG